MSSQPNAAQFFHGAVEQIQAAQHLTWFARGLDQLAEPARIRGVGALHRCPAGLGEAKPDNPPVAQFSLTMDQASGHQSVRRCRERRLGDGQSLGEPCRALAPSAGQLQEPVLLRCKAGVDPL